MKKNQKIFFLVSFLIVLALAIVVVFDFITAILGGAILAYLAHPLYKILEKKTNLKVLSGLIVVILTVLILIVPVTIMLNILSKEAYSFYTYTKSSSDMFEVKCGEASGFVCELYAQIDKNVRNTDLAYYIKEGVKKGTLEIVGATSNFLLKIPGMMMDLFIALFVMYYFLKDGQYIAKGFWKVMPFNKKQENIIKTKVSSVTSAVIYGYLVIALVQGILGGIGFMIFGMNSPVLWGMLTFLGALVPFVGTSIVWGPASLFLFISGILQNNLHTVGRGIGLLLYGFLIVGTIDNFLKPKLIGEAARVNPALILIGLFGGLKFFGIIGAIYGPLILAMVLTLFEIYKDEFGVGK